ncbi:MAG: DUF4245 domain-containing protein [Leifsonia sp.]
MAERPPRVVAELGRPETAEETAARKAENSRLYRARKTPNNLVLSLLATVAVVVVIVLAVPRGDANLNSTVDYATVAENAQEGAPETLGSPELPDSWRANTAEYRTGAADNVDSWFIGFLTPGDEFIGMTQAFGANDTWIATQLFNTLGTASVTIEGVDWTVYDNRRSSEDVGNARYALVTTAGDTTWVLAGTADPAEFETLATAIAPTITAED